MGYTKYGTIEAERPDLIQYLVDRNDACRYTVQSGKKVNWVCPMCGTKFERVVNKAVNRGVTCKECAMKSRDMRHKLLDKDDLNGRVFSFLRVIGLCDERSPYDGSRLWLCRCVCGKIVKYTPKQLKKGECKSCGCMKQTIRLGTGKWTKHGMSHSRLYLIWQRMKDRCLNPNNHAFNSYGGRGICICNEWLDFEKFALWAVSNGYSESLSIDRIDVNGNYEPENCRFATKQEQASNRRNTIKITYGDETHTIPEWSKIVNLSENAIRIRYKNGWDVEKILFTPLHSRAT